MRLRRVRVEMASDFNSWKFRAALHVDHTKVSADYGAFSAVLRWTGAAGSLPSAMLQTGNAQAAKSAGADLRFTDANGNELPFDIVEFTQAAAVADARAEIWVQFPSLSSLVDTVFYMFWGNSAASGYASGDPFGRYNAFAGWNMVYHGNDTGSGNMTNSRASTWGMTNSGTAIVDGKIGKAREFTHADSTYMYISGGLAAGNPNYGTYLSIMFWAKFKEFTNQYQRMVDFGTNSPNDTFLCANDTNTSGSRIDLYNNGVVHSRIDAGIYSTSDWVHIIMTWNNAAATLDLYKNGAKVGSSTSASNWLRDAARAGCYLGRSYFNTTPTDVFDGYLDEIRIGNSVSSSVYASVAYNAQSSPETFIIYDSVVEKPVFPANWKYKCPLTQDHTKVGTGTQSNFPSVFVWTGSQATSNLPQVMFDADGSQPANSNGSDLRFTSDAAGTTQLPFEIVSFSTDNNPANARAEIWVKIPSVNSSTDTIIYVWWGKSDAVAYLPAEIYGQFSVWMSSYKGVYHGNGTGNLADSTLNNYPGVNSGTTTTDGKVGKARSCNGTSQYAAVSGNLGITNGDITEELWLNANNATLPGATEYAALFSHNDNSVMVDYRISQYKTGICVCRLKPGVTWNPTNETAISAGQWYHAALTYSGTTLTFYLNGAYQHSITTSGNGSSSYTTQTVIGRGASALAGFPGMLDEIRISNIARDANWILTDYNNQNEPQTFWGVGTVVIIPMVQVVIGNVWKTVTDVYVLISGFWKSVTARKILTGGLWKDF